MVTEMQLLLNIVLIALAVFIPTLWYQSLDWQDKRNWERFFLKSKAWVKAAPAKTLAAIKKFALRAAGVPFLLVAGIVVVAALGIDKFVGVFTNERKEERRKLKIVPQTERHEERLRIAS